MAVASGTGIVITTSARRSAARDDLRLRRGVHVGAEHWKALDDDERYRLRVEALVASSRNPLLSHWSAAAMWGLPMVGRADETLWTTVVATTGGRSSGDVRRHVVERRPAETRAAGVRVTAPARTVVDLARVGGLVSGLVAADAALRRGLTTLDELAVEARAVGRARGARAARATAELADARCESPGESMSRARFHEHGLPAPELQHELWRGAAFVARVDFWWAGAGVVGEFDGRTKYGLGGDPREALWKEKQREDAIRALGLTVVRWIWQDAWSPAALITRLRTAGVR